MTRAGNCITCDHHRYLDRSGRCASCRVGIADVIACMGLAVLLAAVSLRDHLSALEAMRTR